MGIVGYTRKSKSNMTTDVAKGKAFAQSILGEGLGRLSETGLTGQEMQGARDVATQGISGATQTQSRALRAAQASSGVRGATAGAQQAGVLQQGAQQKADFERDLLLRNRGEQVQAQTFNIGQAAAEKQALAAGGLGFAQMGVAERSAKAKAAASADDDK